MVYNKRSMKQRIMEESVLETRDRFALLAEEEDESDRKLNYQQPNRLLWNSEC